LRSAAPASVCASRVPALPDFPHFPRLPTRLFGGARRARGLAFATGRSSCCRPASCGHPYFCTVFRWARPGCSTRPYRPVVSGPVTQPRVGRPLPTVRPRAAVSQRAARGLHAVSHRLSGGLPAAAPRFLLGAGRATRSLALARQAFHGHFPDIDVARPPVGAALILATQRVGDPAPASSASRAGSPLPLAPRLSSRPSATWEPHRAADPPAGTPSSPRTSPCPTTHRSGFAGCGPRTRHRAGSHLSLILYSGPLRGSAANWPRAGFFDPAERFLPAMHMTECFAAATRCTSARACTAMALRSLRPDTGPSG